MSRAFFSINGSTSDARAATSAPSSRARAGVHVDHYPPPYESVAVSVVTDNVDYVYTTPFGDLGRAYTLPALTHEQVVVEFQVNLPPPPDATAIARMGVDVEVAPTLAAGSAHVPVAVAIGLVSEDARTGQQVQVAGTTLSHVAPAGADPGFAPALDFGAGAATLAAVRSGRVQLTLRIQVPAQGTTSLQHGVGVGRVSVTWVTAR